MVLLYSLVLTSSIAFPGDDAVKGTKRQMPNTAFCPGQVWLDTDGRPIQAHGGGILYDHDTYYWYGENKDADTIKSGGVSARVDVIGISCYSSRDLLNWRNEGVVLPSVPGDPTHDLHPTKVVERPKVILNKKTNTYVMYAHIDDASYRYARVGVATSDKPTGPFAYRGSYRPCDSESRDMTVFKDDDAKAYVVFSSEMNSVTKIAELTDDYLACTGKHVRVFDTKHQHSSREAHAVFKRAGSYYMITSGCTGWDSNATEYATASTMMGPWTVHGNPCVGADAETTFHAQSTYVVPVAGKPDSFIFMADRWLKEDLRDSRYVWLPLRFVQDRIEIRWADRWNIADLDEK